MQNKINITNYEAFLLDHMEGNLSGADLALLKEFVLLHPELEINLEDTELVTLDAENISFTSKEHIKKTGVSISDEQFTAYVENTLSKEEKEKLELACSADAALAKELRLYKTTIVKADASIVFENKQALKKQNKLIYFNTRVYVSAAAALLLIFGLWFVFRTVDTDNSNSNKLSENKNSINTNTLAGVNSNTIANENNTYTSNISIEKQQTPDKNLANNIKTPVTNSFTTALIVKNKIDSIKPDKEEKIVVIKKDSVMNEPKIATTNPPVKKNTYIVTEGSDDDVADNSIPKEKSGFWNKATKALKNLNKLGVKKVDAQETVANNNDQTVLSLGNFKIEKNRYD